MTHHFFFPKDTMILILFSFCFSKIDVLTTEKYNKEISDKKNRNRVWVFLLYKPYCKRYKETLNAFEQAKILTNGTVKYASINCQGDPLLCNNFKVNEFPSIVFKNKTVFDIYQDQINPKIIAKTAFKYIPQTNVKIVDDFWIDDLRDQPTAILFTEKSEIPGYWSALSRVFPPSKLRFGLCNDDGLFPDYNITNTPKIVFYNQTHEVAHEGLRKIRFLKETALSFVQKRENKNPIPTDYFANSQYPEICFDYSVSCVFSYENFVDPKLDDLKSRYKNDPFRFFSGNQHFPFPNIKRGQYVIYNAKKNAIIIVDDISLLSSALDRVLDGGAKWSPIEQDFYSHEL